MNKNNNSVPRIEGTSKLERPRFGPGMLLEHEDLEQLSIYTRELNRLMFRSFFGCGVVCGLVVSSEEHCGKVYVMIEEGLALSCSGDPVHVPKNQRFVMDEHCDQSINEVWVVLCALAKCCAPRTPVCASDEDENPSVCTRERYGFEIKVVKTRPECVCRCPEPPEEEVPREPEESECKCILNPDELPCYRDHYDGKCGCECGECSDCDCKCILLARLNRIGDTNDWRADHRVRRFIRPVLMRDPVVEAEQRARFAAHQAVLAPTPPPAPPVPPVPPAQQQPAQTTRPTTKKQTKTPPKTEPEL